MRRFLVPACLLLCAVGGSGAAGAAETDQYLAWGVELEDSTPVVNAYVNQELERVLERLARRSPDIACEKIPLRFYKHLFRDLLHSRLRRYLHRHPEVDVFPGREVSYWQHLRRSIFRKPAFPFFLPMARTMRIGEIRLGVDKLSHMFGMGRRSYRRYLRHLEEGLAREEAMRRVVVWNLRLERFTVGGLTDGVVSLGDIEANFQGLLLARDLCVAEPPFLVRSGGVWRLDRPIDLRRYVNPRFDESYYPSLFIHGRWAKVRPVLYEEHCPAYHSPEVQALLQRYREIDRPSLAIRVIAERLEEKHGERWRRQSLDEVCGAPPPALAMR